LTTIDRSSPIPIYHQLRDIIRSQIEDGTWGPGQSIPTEQELCHTYAISRAPVRQALGELVNEGLLVRRPGLGTFVAVMPRKRGWTDERAVEFSKGGSLEPGWAAGLRSYLRSGLHVLDAGCGPGAVTLDAALKIRPGAIIGVDIEEELIEEARALAETISVDNATFQVGDTYALEFPDGAFDLTYSVYLLEFIRDPVRALREQKRVTRAGGQVIAVTSDWQSAIVYPPCPALERVQAAWRHLNDPSDEGLFMDTHRGRQVVKLFREAGLKEITVEVHSVCRYPGPENADSSSKRGSLLWDPKGPAARHHQKLMALGVLDEETLLAALAELDAWRDSPDAFSTHALVLAAGRA